MRRSDKLIQERAEIARIFSEALVGRLGLIDGGRPYVVPLNFALEGDELWFHCASEGRKLECIQADASVCFEVDKLNELKTGASACNGFTSYYESAIAFGRAEIVADDAARLRGLQALMRKYSGTADWEFDPAKLAKTTVVCVRIESVTGKRSPAAG